MLSFNRTLTITFGLVTSLAVLCHSDNHFLGWFSDALTTNQVYSAESKKKIGVKNGMNFLGPASMELHNVELISFLENYSEIYEFSFFIDRRVDPTTNLSGTFIEEPFVSALDKLLTDVDLSFCIVDNEVLYIGPHDAAGEALLLFAVKRGQMQKQAPRIIAEKLNSKINFDIDNLTQPREIFEALGKRAKLKFSGFDKTPFDLWLANSFQNVIVGDLLTMMGLGFNVDYRYDSESASIKPCSLNREQTVSRSYTRVYGVQIEQSRYPNCVFSEKMEEGETVISVIGAFSDLAQIEYEYSTIRRKAWSEQMDIALDIGNSPKSERVPNSNKSTRTHVEVSGSVSNQSLSSLFDYLKNSSKIRCVLDPSMEELGISLDTRVSCKFNHSDVKEIAGIIAKQIGAKTIIEGSKITFTRD